MKQSIKRLLVSVGLRHPAKGVKISQDQKAKIILSYKTSDISTFVETGTHTGWMIGALKPLFHEIYSVELDDDLYKKAVQRFQGEKKIHLYNGDSATVIKIILKNIVSPTIFWLDAHGPGEITLQNSPVEAELDAIFNHSIQGHIIVIDDARHFSRHDIHAIRRLARLHNYCMSIEDGLFQLTPRLK